MFTELLNKKIYITDTLYLRYDIKAFIEAEEKGQYTYKDKKLTFVIKATQVEVEGEPLENFSVTTFSFDMVKK